MSRVLNSLIGFILLLYPALVYLGIQVMMPWKIAAVLLTMLMIRFCLFPANRPWDRLLIGAGVLYCAFAVWHNSEISLRLYPVLVNLGLLLLFSVSLVYPPPIIERLARLQHPNLSAKGVSYTRKVTQVWCVFFVANGLIAAATAVWADFFWWGLYNGCIAYVLIGLLMAIEYITRLRMQKHGH
jgi:uncharacterized membrane protein